MAFTARIADLIADDKTGLLTKHESWERVRLSEVADILNGAPFDSAKFRTAGGTPLARIRDVRSGETTTYYTGEYDDAYILAQGDLLVGMDGDFNTGYWGSQRALLNQRVCKVTPNTAFYDKALLGHVLPGYLAAINASTPSVTVKHLSSRTVGEIELPLPPRAEQSRIADKLEELLSDLDAGVAELKTAQRKLAQYRQSLLKAAVEGTLTADWRAAHGAPQETGAELLQRILTERRARWEQKQLVKYAEKGKTPPKGWQAKYPEPVALDPVDLAPLPESWAWATLGQCFHIAVGATPSRKEASYWNGSIPWVSSGEVRFTRINGTRELITQDGLRNSSTQINPIGSVLLGMIGEGKTRGQVAVLDVEAANNQNCVAIWVAETDVPPEFVYFWLWSRYDETRRGSSGNNQPALNKAIVESISLPLPPLEEQREIVAVVDAQFAAVTQHQVSIEAGLALAAAQRKNILKAAFAGQLVPQDPNDEPASELLARIRAKHCEEVRERPSTSRARKAR